MRGMPLDMDQYRRLFGTARVPTDVRLTIITINGYHCLTHLHNQHGCRMETEEKSRHVAIIRRGQICACIRTLYFVILSWLVVATFRRPGIIDNLIQIWFIPTSLLDVTEIVLELRMRLCSLILCIPKLLIGRSDYVSSQEMPVLRVQH